MKETFAEHLIKWLQTSAELMKMEMVEKKKILFPAWFVEAAIEEEVFLLTDYLNYINCQLDGCILIEKDGLLFLHLKE